MARVAEIAGELAATGVGEIAIADTIGVAVPRDVTRRVAAVAGLSVRCRCGSTSTTPATPVTRARWRRMRRGAGARLLTGRHRRLPFAPRATGNIATEDLVFALERSGIDTGLDLDELCRSAEWLGEQLGRPVPGLVSKAGPFPPR